MVFPPKFAATSKSVFVKLRSLLTEADEVAPVVRPCLVCLKGGRGGMGCGVVLAGLQP